MKSEPLNIADKTFLINRLIQQAPTGTLVREFFKNADENAALAEPGNRLVRVYPVEIDGVRKLAFWNTGVGMDEHELKRATDLSSSINKQMALDGNIGIGAKVSGLTMSHEGIRYRSCKGGKVHEVTIGYDRDEATYVRFAVEMPDGTSETVYDVTAAAVSDGHALDFDWTEVVLFGQSPDHDTVAYPLGLNKETERSYVATTIFRRFASFSEGVEVRIDTAMTKGGGREDIGKSRTLRTLDEVLDRLGTHQLIRVAEKGLGIRFIHDPKSDASSHTLSARANAATASTTFCALVHKGERYDFRTKNSWHSIAPEFGIPFGSKVLTVEIHIDDELALPNQYRDALTRPSDRSSITITDFTDVVRSVMPDWVKEIIKTESPEAKDNLSDLQSDLQRLLDQFRVPTIAMAPTKLPDLRSDVFDDGTPAAESSSVADDGEYEASEARSRKAAPRAGAQKVRKAPEGSQPSQSSKALERVPEITILDDPAEIEAKKIKGRAGRYYKDSHSLFINGLYPVVERMAYELEREFAGSAEPEVLRANVLKAARRFMAFRVGKAACFAITKKMLTQDWSADDLDAATSPESLSMAADDYTQSLAPARRWIKDELKTAQAEALTGVSV
jgi:hypothetical protein